MLHWKYDGHVLTKMKAPLDIMETPLDIMDGKCLLCSCDTETDVKCHFCGRYICPDCLSAENQCECGKIICMTCDVFEADHEIIYCEACKNELCKDLATCCFFCDRLYCSNCEDVLCICILDR